MTANDVVRCPWLPIDDDLYVRYHDEEWGVPVHDDRLLFEMLNLEGAQAGLSWRTVLHKRDHYRKVFAGFDPEKLARFDAARVQRLLTDPGIIRNRLKVESTISNAKAFLNLRDQGIHFDQYLWGFVDGIPPTRRPKVLKEYRSQSVESDRMSKDLKRRGFRFVGTTICYAFMQAVGMIDDHSQACFRSSQEK